MERDDCERCPHAVWDNGFIFRHDDFKDPYQGLNLQENLEAAWKLSIAGALMPHEKREKELMKGENLTPL